MLKTHCKYGHEYTTDNTYVHTNTGTRSCRTCRTQVNKGRKKDPAKMRQYRANWRQRNPDYHKEHWLKRQYNMSLSDLEVMITNQGGKCAICEDDLTTPQVDHDHNSGKVRQLLCVGCNTGIGSFRERADILTKALAYLEKHKNA